MSHYKHLELPEVQVLPWNTVYTITKLQRQSIQEVSFRRAQEVRERKAKPFFFSYVTLQFRRALLMSLFVSWALRGFVGVQRGTAWLHSRSPTHSWEAQLHTVPRQRTQGRRRGGVGGVGG